MKLPGPDHPITITPEGGCVRVRFGGAVIAETRRALRLQEARYPPVFYIPPEDAVLALMTPSTHRTHCPYKGDADYLSITAGGRQAVNAVWRYADPFPAVAAIAGMLAFYPDRVDPIEVDEPHADPQTRAPGGATAPRR